MWTVVLVVTVALLPCVFSQYQEPTPKVWHVNQYPDPWWFHEACNRDNKSAICDPNGIISKQAANEIDRMITAVALNTRCPCYQCVSHQRGYVIRVALMEEMEPLLNLTDNIMDKLKNARLFSYLLTQRWKLTGNCNETVLIVYSRQDNVLYTIPGSQAGMKLKDNLISEISLDVRGFFDDRDTIADGLKEMIKRYRLVFQDKYSRTEADKTAYDRDRNGRGGAGLITWSPVMLLVTMVMLILS